MNDVLYVAVVVGEGPYYGMVPDFAILASGNTREAVIEELQKLANEEVEISNRYGTAIPKATAKNIIESKWQGHDYYFTSVMVRI